MHLQIASTYSRRQFYHGSVFLSCCLSNVSSGFSLHSSIRRKLVGNDNKVIDTLTDSLPETVNKYADIEFSLNKKGRWTLPNQLRDNIQHGHFQDEEYGVQLIEEHRLLKKANCISFTSNFGSVRHTSKEKGRKRTRRGRKNRGYFQISSILNAKPANAGKRRRKSSEKLNNNDTSETSVEASEKFSLPELRYEITYPSPVTSSITHNPNYIDPCYSENSRSKRRAKLLKTRSKFDDFIEESLEIFDSDFDEDLYYTDEDEHTEYEEIPAQKEDFTLQEILFHANKAQMLVMSSGKQRTSKGSSEFGDKRKEALTDIHKHTIEGGFDNTDGSVAKRCSQKFAKGLNYSTTLEHVTVIIPSDDTDEWTLKQKFGNRLLECECFPRKFIINISKEVSKLGSLKSIGKSKADLTFACLVFVHDVDNEINNPNENVYKVYLNMPFTVKMNQVKIETIFDYAFTNIDDIIEKTIFFVDTLPYEVFKKQKAQILPTKSASSSNLEEYADWKSQSYRLDNKVLIKMCFQGKDDHEHSVEEQSGFEHLSKMDVFVAEPKDVSSPKDKFCSVCFEAIGEAISGTALMSCCHWFCDPCWKTHLLTRIGDGKTRLVCPEYDCNKEVDIGTLLSLADVNHVLKFLKFSHDIDVERQSETKWCPNPNCGAILKVSSPRVKTASCQCGRKICFDCLGEAHWPAPCGAVAGYHRKIAGHGDNDLIPSKYIPDVVVKGKCCPSCKRFVEKDGGCPCMSCPCGEAFCWGCGQKWYGKSHGDYCYKHGYSNLHGTVAKSIQPEDYLISKIRTSNRADWYKTALEHRIQQHRVKIRNMKAPMKNLAFNLQRYVQCAEKRNEPVSFDFELPGILYLNEANKTRDFLQNMLDLYSELHRIAEHVPIYLETVYPDKEVPAVDRITSRMTALTVSICNALQYGANDNPKEVLDNLKEIRFHARNCIAGLLKFINPDKSSRAC